MRWPDGCLFVALKFARLFVFDLAVQALAEPFGYLILDTIPDQSHDIPGSVQNRAAVRAAPEVGLHARTELCVDLPVEKIGDLLPNLQATDFNHRHWIHQGPLSFATEKTPYHGRTFSYSAFPLLQLPSIPGASASRM